jgi:cell division initiation protein
LTAADIEQKVFKKVFLGGYAVSEVEEFLSQAIDDVKAYAVQLNEQKARISELEESVKKYESMEETIKDTLIMTQKIAQEKQEEAERQAALRLAELDAKRNEIDEERRSRLDEANKTAEEITAAAHASAAQIAQDAENMRSETERRFESLDQEIEQRLAEANDRVGQITANARLEARRMLGKTQTEIEESERALAALRSEKERFLREFSDLLSQFGDSLRKIQEGPANEISAGFPEPSEPSAEEPARKSEPEGNAPSSPLELFGEANEEAKNEEINEEKKDEAVFS